MFEYFVAYSISHRVWLALRGLRGVSYGVCKLKTLDGVTLNIRVLCTFMDGVGELKTWQEQQTQIEKGGDMHRVRDRERQRERDWERDRDRERS